MIILYQITVTRMIIFTMNDFDLKLSGIQFYEGTITDPKNYKFEYNTTSF
jgi:hypothetical protein